MSKLSPTLTLLSVASIAVAFAVGVAGATATTDDTLVTTGSPPSPFSQNKQNEPAVAVNPYRAEHRGGGRQRRDRHGGLQQPRRHDVSVHDGRRRVRHLLLRHRRRTRGRSRRTRAGPPATAWASSGRSRRTRSTTAIRRSGRSGRCRATTRTASSRTATRRSASARCPTRNGHFAWTNGWRLYYANLAANFSAERSEQTFKGFEAIAVSRLDSQNYAAAKAGDNNAWKAPVIVVEAERGALLRPRDGCGRRRGEQSVLRQRLRLRHRVPKPGEGAASRRRSWSTARPTAATRGGRGSSPRPAANNKVGGRQDCAVDTDSDGNVYVFWDGFDSKSESIAIFMVRSSDGGKTFARPAKVVTPIVDNGPARSRAGRPLLRRRRGRARRLVPDDLDRERSAVRREREQRDRARVAGRPDTLRHAARTERAACMCCGRRTAAACGTPAASPLRRPIVRTSPRSRSRRAADDAYLTYMNFLQPWQSTTAVPRMFGGVVRHADVDPRERCGRRVERPPPRGAHGRCPRVERQRADGRVPRRLQLRVRDERRAWSPSGTTPGDAADCPRDRHVPAEAHRRHGDVGRGRPGSAGAGQRLPADVRQHRHPRRLVRGSDAVERLRRMGGRQPSAALPSQSQRLRRTRRARPRRAVGSVSRL